MLVNSFILLLTAALSIAPQALAAPTPNQSSPDHELLPRKDKSPWQVGDYTCTKNGFPQYYKMNDGEKADSFEEGALFRKKSEPVCNVLIDHLLDAKKEQYNWAYHERISDSVLYHDDSTDWDRPLIVNYRLEISEKGKALVKGKKEGDQWTAHLKKRCTTFLEEYGTKGTGCTKDKEFHNTSHNVKRTTTTGVLAGEQTWKHDGDLFATVKVSYGENKKADQN